MATQTITPTLNGHLSVPGVRFLDHQMARANSCPKHCHDDWELVYLLEGSMREERREGVVQRRVSSLSLLPAGHPHRLEVSEAAWWLEIRIEPEWLAGQEIGPQYVESPSDFRGGAPVWFAQRLYREFRSSDSLSALVMEALLVELLADIHRMAQPRPTPSCPAGCVGLPIAFIRRSPQRCRSTISPPSEGFTPHT